MERIFIGLLTKNGKKVKAQNIFYTVAFRMSKRHRVMFSEILNQIFNLIEPLLDYSVLRKGSTNYIYPRRITPWRAKSLAVRWIIDSAKLRKERGFSYKLEGELNDLLSKKGGALVKRMDFHRRAVSNRFVLKKKFKYDPKFQKSNKNRKNVNRNNRSNNTKEI